MTASEPGDRRAVRDIYRLTPMQEGMLFHALSSPGTPLYLQQHVLDVGGADGDDLAYACDELVRRHDVLRTGFVWEGIDRPVQVVFATAPSPLTIEARGTARPDPSDVDVEAWVAATLRAQQERSFDIRHPPLMAMNALPVGSKRWRVVVAHHHLILDGWSVPILHDELAVLLRGHRYDPSKLREPRPFRDFVALLSDRADDGGYWKDTFADLGVATPLAVDRVGRVTQPNMVSGTGRVTLLRPAGHVGDLAAVARRVGLLPSTVVHAAWALLLCRYNGLDDATFGLTLSGRSADLTDVHYRVGMFVNSLPLRVRCRDDAPVVEWLRRVQHDLRQVNAREHSSLADIARASAIPAGRPLYESVVAFQNYWHAGLDDHRGETGEAVRVVATRERTSVPVAIAVALPSEGVWVRLDYDDARLDRPAATAMASHYLDLVEAIAAALANGGDVPLGHLRLVPDDAARPDADQQCDPVAELAAELAAVGARTGDRVLLLGRPSEIAPDALRDALVAAGLEIADADEGTVDITIGPPRILERARTPAPVRIFVDEGPAAVPSGIRAYRLFGAGGRASLTALEGPSDGGRIGARSWMLIVDRQGHRCVDGAVGELRVAGRDGMTATGLSARVRTDGDIDVMGVFDGTECDERDWVARTMAMHRDVADAVIVDDGDGHTIAWLVPAGMRAPDDMASHMNRLVPPELQPADIEFIERLPLNADGRVNRGALVGGAAAVSSSPATPLRDILAALPEPRRTQFLDALRHRPVRGPRRRRAGDPIVRSFAQEQWALMRGSALRDVAEAVLGLAAVPVAEKLDAAIRSVVGRYELPATPDVVISWADGTPTITVRVDPIVADGLGALVLARDIAATVGGSSDPPPPRLTYADYAAWQTDPRRAEERDAQLASWRQRLDGAPPLGIVPERVPPGAAGVGNYRLPVPVNPPRPPTAADWTAAVAVVVAGLGRADDIVIGAVVRPGLCDPLAGAVGPFSRMLPVRVTLDAATTVGGLRARVADELAHAAAHPDVPWPHVRDLLAEPLTAAVAVYDGGYGAVREPIAGVSLAVEIDRAEIAVRYDAARWHPATVAALTSRIVAESTAPDDRALTDAVRIDNATRAIVVGWGDGRTTAQISPATVPHLIAAAARSTPQAIAVDGPDGLLTYAELIERATSLSSWLRDRGVGVEDRVALCVPRGTAMVWAALGVLMAGAAYVPVDAHWPEQRRDHVLSDARIRAVVTVADHRSLFGQADVVCTIDEVTAPAGAIPVEIAAGLTERCAAYVIYTSGSTGAPKGVVVEHRSVVNFVRQIAEAYAIDAQTRLLGFAALTFDLHVFDIWTALGCGATLVLAGDAERQSADALQRLLRDKRVTAAELPPSLMPLLAPEDLPTLRLVSVGGEAPAATLVDTWATPARQMWNGYGPTETTVAVTLMRCEAPSGGRTPPIGRPMPNHRAYVLDEGLRLVAPGVPGELCIAGIGVARGYVGAPGATATRFVPDPYSNVAGARLYRTGDLVRWTGDGLLEFLGRVDRQVKIRGFRIELGEVEAALNEDERVRQAVVDIHDDATGTRHLVAYVVPADRAEAIDLGAVRDMAGRRLPEYMLPTRLAVLDKLPVTAHGKLDRRRLAALARAGVSVLLDNSSAAGGSDASASVGPDASASAGSGGDDPDTPTERAIVADIFAPLLGLAGIGSGDDFFRLGGSSLQAMQVTARVRDRFAVEVGLADFFVEPTARRLARLVEAAIRRREEEQSDLYGGSPRPTEAVASAGGDIDRPTGLSYPQLRMWQLNEREPGHPSHHAPLALRLTGALDFAALRQAISRIVQRHAPLRSRFTATGQTFAAYATVPVDVVDVRESEIARLVREESERPFDLVNGPMIRVTLFRIADDDHVLQWNVHHIVTDAWSIGVMLGELFTLYNGCRDGSAPELPALPAHYRDFVEWQRAFVASPEYAEQLTWWRSHLSGMVTDSRLPTDAPRGGRFRLGWRNTRLSADETKAAIEIGRRHGVTLFMATLACWSLALAADADFDDLVVAVPLAGRKRTEWEPLVGYFVNRVLIRVPLERGLTFADLLDQVRAETAAAFAHQDVPFESLIRELGVPLSAISVNFSIQNAPQGSAGLGGLRIGPVIDDSGRDFAPIMELYSPVGARFEASMVLRQRADGLAGGLEYDASLFSAQRAEGWARRFGLLLVTAASEPHVALNEFRDMARSVSVPAMR